MKRLRGPDGSPSDRGGLVGPSGSAPASSRGAKRAELQKIKDDLECRRSALKKEGQLRQDEFLNAPIGGSPAFTDFLNRMEDIAGRLIRCDLELEILDKLPKPGPDPAPEEEHNKKWRPLRDECIRACGGDMRGAKGKFIKLAGRKPYFASPQTAKNVWSMLGRAQRKK